ncbi:butyrophilin subfamily 2 member A1 [Paramisgurnus dabryanus]|uniref:butyrophilin subfamily 2 member A1 n=1 Tax=Paramisgurnus dabryanus TaxID=90735 RepID=UPI0031F45E7C
MFSHPLKLSERCSCTMHISHPTSVLLLLAVLCNLLVCLAGVTVKYPRDPYTKAEGDTLTLKCMVHYEPKTCKDIKTRWCCLDKVDHCSSLKDPSRYLIQVNETQEKEYRQRSIFVTFNSLTRQDTAYYQCNAVCSSGTEGKGHLVHLNVTGLKASKWSGQSKVDTALLTLSVALLLWS